MERKERLLRKALELYGVSEEEANEFMLDLAKLDEEDVEPDLETEPKVDENGEVKDAEAPETEEEVADEVVEEEGSGEEVVEEETETEPQVEEEVVSDKPTEQAEPETMPVEEEVAPVEPQVDYDAKIEELKATIETQHEEIKKLYEMVSALGINVDANGDVEEHNPFGNQKVSPMPREENGDDWELRRRLGGGKY